MNNQLPVIFGWLFLLAGIFAVFFSIRRLCKSKESLGWPVCNGNLIDGSLVDYGAQGRNFSLTVKYDYIVNQQKFFGFRVCFYSLADKKECELILDELRKYNSIKVYYNPKKYQDSVLIPGPDKKPYSEIFIASIAMFSGALLILFL